MVEHTHPGECNLIGLIVTLNTRFVSMSNAIQTSLEANYFGRQEFSRAMSDDRKLLLHNPCLTWMNDIAI